MYKWSNAKRFTQCLQELALLYKYLKWMVFITFRITLIYPAAATSYKYAAQRNVTAQSLSKCKNIYIILL